MEKIGYVNKENSAIYTLTLEKEPLSKFFTLFIGNHNRFGEKIKGSWTSKKERVGKNLIQSHLNRNRIIGSYYAYRGQGTNYCHFVCLDIDFHKTPKSETLEGEERKNYEKSAEYREEVSVLMNKHEIIVHKALNFIERKWIPSKSIVLENSKRGFHIWIFLQRRTTLKRARTLVEVIGEQIQSQFPSLNHIDLFPRQGSLPDGSIGNFVKLPLLENLSKPLDDLGQCNIEEQVKEIRKSRRNMRKTIHMQSKRKSKATNYTKPKIEDKDLERFILKLRPCLQEIVNGSRQAQGENGQYIRIQVTNELYQLGASQKVRIDAFRQQNDFDESITAYQVNDLEQRSIENKKSYLAQCDTIEKMGFCVPWCYKTGCTDTKEQYFQKQKESYQGIKGGWESLSQLIETEVLIPEKRSYIIKTTRSGGTTTTIIETLKKNQKMFVLAPTRKIEETVRNAGDLYEKDYGRYPVIHPIPANKEICKFLQEKINQEPELGEFPTLLKKDCNRCPYKEIRNNQGEFECKFMSIIENIPLADIIYITYSKLRAFQLSNKDIMQELMEIIRDHVDVFFLDEISAILGEAQSPIRLMAQSDGTQGFEDFNIADKFASEVQELQDSSVIKLSNSQLEILTLVEKEIRRWIYEPDRPKDIDESFREPFIFLEESLRIRDKTKNFSCLDTEEIKKRAVILQSHLEAYVKDDGKVQQIQTLRKFVNVLFSEKFYLHITFPQGYKRMLTLHFDTNISETLEYINKIAKGKTLICTDASELPLGIENVFPEISKIIVNDPMDTATKQTVHPDRIERNLSKGFKKNVLALIFFLRTHSNQSTMIICQSISIMIKVMQLCIEHSIPYGKITYFRSSDAVGVECAYRRILSIGTSFGPKDAFFTLAYKYLKEKLEMDISLHDLSQRLSYYDAKSAFFQAISRGKDPEGEIESETLCFGMNTRTVRAMLNFNIATPKIGKHW